MSWGFLKGSQAVRLYARCKPRLKEGRYDLQVSQVVKSQDAASLGLDAAELVRFQINAGGVARPLTGDDLAGIYPPLGKGSSDQRVPHLALKRKTLPWDRSLSTGGNDDTPWVALLLFHPGEWRRGNVPLLTRGVDNVAVFRRNSASTKLLDSGPNPCDHVVIPRDLFQDIRPSRAEMGLLCHVRRLSTLDRIRSGDDDGLVSFVVGNRLPPKENTPGECLAALVSMIGVPDNPSETSLTLRVLFAWAYPVTASDFESGMKAIVSRGYERMVRGSSAGVSRLGADALSTGGRVAASWRDRDGNEVPAWFRGPLVPIPTRPTEAARATASDGLTLVTGSTGQAAPDISYAVAFELGRMAALSDPAVLGKMAVNQRTGQRVVARLDLDHVSTAHAADAFARPPMGAAAATSAHAAVRKLNLELASPLGQGAALAFATGSHPLADPAAEGIATVDATGLRGLARRARTRDAASAVATAPASTSSNTTAGAVARAAHLALDVDREER